MQHFTTLGNAAYKFFKTFRAKTAHVHNLVPTEIVCCLSSRKYSTPPVTADTLTLLRVRLHCFKGCC